MTIVSKYEYILSVILLLGKGTEKGVPIIHVHGFFVHTKSVCTHDKTRLGMMQMERKVQVGVCTMVHA